MVYGCGPCGLGGYGLGVGVGCGIPFGAGCGLPLGAGCGPYGRWGAGCGPCGGLGWGSPCLRLGSPVGYAVSPLGCGYLGVGAFGGWY